MRFVAVGGEQVDAVYGGGGGGDAGVLGFHFLFFFFLLLSEGVLGVLRGRGRWVDGRLFSIFSIWIV